MKSRCPIPLDERDEITSKKVWLTVAQVYDILPEWKHKNKNILGFLSMVRIHRGAYYLLGGEAQSITGSGGRMASRRVSRFIDRNRYRSQNGLFVTSFYSHSAVYHTRLRLPANYCVVLEVFKEILK